MSGKRPPNFVFFVTDQQRADHLGCAGHALLSTPHIDRIAARGTRFANAFCANPICMPSRASMWTGRYPSSHRLRANGMPLDPATVTLPAVLTAHGYRTSASGKIHLSNFFFHKENDQFPESMGFWKKGNRRFPVPYYGIQHYDFEGGHGELGIGPRRNLIMRKHPGLFRRLGPPGGQAKNHKAIWQSWKTPLPEKLASSTWVADQSIRWLKKHAKAGPFFHWCSFPDPHHPFAPPAPFQDMYDPGDVPAPVRIKGELEDKPPHYRRTLRQAWNFSGSQLCAMRHLKPEKEKEMIAHTLGMISLIDKSIGRVMKTLEDLGVLEHTIIVFLSDHGELLGDHHLWFKGPFHYDALIRVPLLWMGPGIRRGKLYKPPVSLIDIFATVLEMAGMKQNKIPYHQGHSLRPILQGRRGKRPDWILVENDDDLASLKLRTLRTDAWKITVYQDADYGELYDLAKDPHEFKNLWHSMRHRRVKQDMKEKLLHTLIAHADETGETISIA